MNWSVVRSTKILAAAVALAAGAVLADAPAAIEVGAGNALLGGRVGGRHG